MGLKKGAGFRAGTKATVKAGAAKGNARKPNKAPEPDPPGTEFDAKWNKLRVKPLEELVSIAEKLNAAENFRGFIRSIRFPHYRNMERNAQLNFSFPLSVFTGPNGCGKSSVLLALYGAPTDQSVGRYWFSTDVDPITDPASGERPSFVYEYKDEEGTLRQPIKIRIQKKFSDSLLAELKREKSTKDDLIFDPNYWEPSRPLAWAGQKARKDRDPTVRRDVLYLHFRTQLSAFESAFYGNGAPSTARREFLRRKSKRLKRALDGEGTHRPRGRAQSKPAIHVGTDVLSEINWVVGKDYKSATAIEHKLFGNDWGISVRFQLANASYSDAFAGSGESAIFRLILALRQAAVGTLVVLDEPEISLHPEAQLRMQRLLLAYAIQRKLQIVLATHSSHFVDGLPESAIFLFEERETGFVARNVPADLAMVSIGQKVAKRQILVEDVLAEEMVKCVIKHLDTKAVELFDVRRVSGGASAVLRALAVDPYHRHVALLDGDQRPSEEAIKQVTELLEKKTVGVAEWTATLNAVTHDQCPAFNIDGSSATGHGDAAQQVAVRSQFAETMLTRVHYLPGDSDPEELVANADALEAYLKAAGVSEAGQREIREHQGKVKDRLMRASKLAGVPYKGVLDTLVARWDNQKGSRHQELAEILSQIIKKT